MENEITSLPKPQKDDGAIWREKAKLAADSVGGY